MSLIKYYFRRFELWRNRKKFKYWWVRLHCNACGKNVFKYGRDYFHLKPKVWKQASSSPVTSPRMVLCKKCTERLLGRKLTKSDYAVPEEFEK